MLLAYLLSNFKKKGVCFLGLLAGLHILPVWSDMIDTSNLEPWETCALCHGLYGNSTRARFPKLAGQNREYLLHQLNNFRQERRTNDGGQMQAIVHELTLDQLNKAVNWFSSQPDPTPSDKELAAKLVAEIDVFVNSKSESPSACHQCHNPTANEVPVIRSQHADYLEKQLNDFKHGKRTSQFTNHDFLAHISDQQIAWLAKYFASLPRK